MIGGHGFLTKISLKGLLRGFCFDRLSRINAPLMLFHSAFCEHEWLGLDSKPGTPLRLRLTRWRRHAAFEQCCTHGGVYRAAAPLQRQVGAILTPTLTVCAGTTRTRDT